MPEEGAGSQTTAEQPASAPAGGAGAPAAAPTPGIDPVAHDRLKQQVAGLTPWMEGARKAGFGRVDDFDGYAKSMDRLKRHGVTLDDILGQLDALGTQAQPGNGRQAPEFDPEAFKAELRAERERERALERATREYEDADRSEAQLIEKLFGESFTDLTDGEKRLYLNALRYELDVPNPGTKDKPVRGLYDSEHPLSGTHLRRHDEAAISERVRGLVETRKLIEGERLKGKAEAARKQTPAVGGNAQGQGKTEPEERGSAPTDREIQEAYDALRARRGGRPVSAAR